MNKKTILQIAIGIILAVGVFLAIFLPINNCKGSPNNSSSKSIQENIGPENSGSEDLGDWGSNHYPDIFDPLSSN